LARLRRHKAIRLVRGLDFNQVIIGPTGFLDDFYRARSNGFLALSAGLGFNPAFNPAVAGSQPLTVISQAASAGLLTNATIRGAIQRGEAGELAGLYHLNALAGNLTLVSNPITGVADVNTNGPTPFTTGSRRKCAAASSRVFPSSSVTPSRRC
jgi:hypothetical protein